MSNTRSVDDENVMAATEGLELTTAEEGATASGVLSIDSLQSFGVSATDLKKAKEAGFNTVRSLVMHSKSHLLDVRGFSDAKVDKLLDACRKALSNPSERGGFVTAATFREMRKDIVKITTGSKAVDEVLAGGIQTRSITEIHGEWRCGKTQLCHTLAVSTQLPFEMGGGYAKVAYIDTEGTFRSERILEIAERYGMDGEAVLENIMIARTFTHEQMEDALLTIAGKMAEEPFKLLIVDSVMAHYRVDFTGRGELSGRQQRLGQFMSKLSKLADEFNLAIVCTNQVQSDPGAMAFAGVEPKKPIGGHVLAHASTIRLCVRKGRAEARVLKVMQGPDLKEQDAEFMISNGGVVDIE